MEKRLLVKMKLKRIHTKNIINFINFICYIFLTDQLQSEVIALSDEKEKYEVENIQTFLIVKLHCVCDVQGIRKEQTTYMYISCES